jgi:hypothetical protein
MATDSKFTKAIDSTLSIQTEYARQHTLTGNKLKYTLCDRDEILDKKGHYFMSFNLPTDPNYLGTGSTMAKLFPELYQLNVDRILIVEIPASEYSEFIDGRSIMLRVPVSGGTAPNSLSAVTIVSSTYSSDKILRSETNLLLGDNVAFLFSDDINKPYTGKTFSEIGEIQDHSKNTTWFPNNGLNLLDRPSAVSYSEVKVSDKAFNTDKRTNVSFAVPAPTNYPDGRAGYNYDIPVGFAILDKGFIVITHPQIVNNFLWSESFKGNGTPFNANTPMGGTNLAYYSDVYFTGDTMFAGSQVEASQLTFQEVNTAFKTTAVCLAMPREFYISNNPTWDRAKVLAAESEDTGIAAYDPIYITEIGLYNALGELIAVAKLSEPVEKTYTNVLTFNIEIEM